MSSDLNQFDIFGNKVDYEKNETLNYLLEKIKHHEKKIVKAQEKIFAEEREIKRLKNAIELMINEKDK